MLCELCQTDAATSRHHLIPRTLHSNKWFKRRYTRQEMQQGVNLCGDCHRAIHRMVLLDDVDVGEGFLEFFATTIGYPCFSKKHAPQGLEGDNVSNGSVRCVAFP